MRDISVDLLKLIHPEHFKNTFNLNGLILIFWRHMVASFRLLFVYKMHRKIYVITKFHLGFYLFTFIHRYWFKNYQFGTGIIQTKQP